MSPLITLLACICLMYVLGEIFRFFSIPRVLSQIAAGLVLGFPVFQKALFPPASIALVQFLSDIGVILLLFFVGLQVNLKQFGKELPASVRMSLFNTFLPLFLGTGVSYFVFGLDWPIAVIVGICMSVSASAIALDILEEYNKLQTRIGSRIVSAGALDDVLEVFLITGALTFLETTIRKTTLLQLASGTLIFVMSIFIFRFWLIPILLHRIEKQPEHAQLFTGALIIMLVMAILADYLGVGVLIGALFSGIILRQVLLKEPGHKPWERTEITQTIHTISFGFVVPFFFFYIGFQTDLFAIWNNLFFSVVLTFLAIGGTLFGTAFGYYITYKNWTEGLLVGWAMNAKGDTELIIAQLALSVGAISPAIFSSLIFMAIVSTLISPLMLRPMLEKVKAKI